MFATAFHTSRHYILFTAIACLCVLLGGPSYAAGADSLIIAGAMYYEPGASGPGWVWTDADHLELNGYTGEAIGADDDLVVTLTGQNTVVETSAPNVDISRCGMEVWGDMTLSGSGSLVATGSQCGIYVSGTLAVNGCKVDARADGAGIACLGGSLASARFVAPAGGAFGTGGVVDADGSVASHVVVEPDVATPPAGETDGGDVTGGGTSDPAADANPAAGKPTTGPTANPVLKPTATPTKTTTTETKTTVAKVPKPKAVTATTVAFPKTGDSNWIAASFTFFLLGTTLLAAAYRC